MAPEQVRGYEVTPAADVYALGAILFEILAGQGLHPHGDAALATTLTTPQAAPAQRATDRQIPPELDAACFDALAEDAPRRPSARRLAERVQAYLDGDRDLERRHTMATNELAAAREALLSSASNARATAMRRAGRALALDPSSTEAAEIVTSLMLAPPDPMPSELIASLEAEDRAYGSDRGRVTLGMVASLFSFWIIIPFLSVKNWAELLGFYGLLILVMMRTWSVIRTGRTRIPATLVVMTLLVVAFSRLLGPFILTPIVVCAILVTVCTTPEFHGRMWLVFGWSIVAMGAPIILERLGVLASTYALEPGALMIRSDGFNLRASLVDELALILTNVFYVAVIGLVAYKLNERRVRAQRQLHVQAWHLKQLLPGPRAQSDITHAQR
jgi:serine/threonine-protein kinase